MVGTKYLSELVDVELFENNKLNVIKAPTGSGKTYFALSYIPSLCNNATHEIVYLIDTINGKEQILQNYNAISEYAKWQTEITDGGVWFVPDKHVVVITYAKFGVMLEKHPDFYDHFSYIICDEIHSLLKFQNFSAKPNVHSVAREGLEKAVIIGHPTVIALTAPPNSIYKDFNAPAVEIPIDQNTLIHYEVANTVGYTNIDYVLNDITHGMTGLCYFSRITQMKELEERTKKLGFKPICIWSIGNVEHKMTDEQLAVRENILKYYTIPENYALLIINSSSETSIKIKSPVDFVIVHSSNEDTQIQVRGRVNSDLQTLYLPTVGTPTISIPDNYLDKKLFLEDKTEMLSLLDLRNRNNRTLGWNSVKSILIDNDYTITEGRYQNKRYSIIHKNIDK